MHIKHITVKNFRCFEHLEFDLNPDINIFVGNNGSGKSAVLDAIAAAMFPYISELQRIVGNETEDPPFFSKDLPVTSKNNQKVITEFLVSTNDLTNWKTIYNKPLADDDTGLYRYTYSSHRLVDKNHFNPS
ncbi:MAG: AAA family ATPase [Snowella sp.]